MTAPQLDFYAADRAGRTAIIHTATGNVIAWIVRDGDHLYARSGTWISEPVETIPQAIRIVSERFAEAAPSERVES